MKKDLIKHQKQSSRTLVDVIENTVSRFPDRGITHVLPESNSEDFQSYSDLMHQAKKTTGLFYRKGILPGDHVILAPASSKSFLTLFWGCLMGGIVPVPLPSVRNPKVDSMEAEKIFNVWKVVNSPIVCESRDETVFPLLTDIFKQTGATIMAADELIAETELINFPDEDLYRPTSDEIAVLQFSSGSTGLPKGAQLTHRNLISNIKAKLKAERGNEDDCLCSWLPYFHDFGLFGCHLMPLYAGMRQIKIDPLQFARRPFLWMEKIYKHRATITSSTNTGVEYLVNYLLIKKGRILEVDLSCIKAFSLGAEMVSVSACKKLAELLSPCDLNPDVFIPGYGLTETTLVATAHTSGEPLVSFLVDRNLMISKGIIEYQEEASKNTAEFASVGLPVQDCKVRIVDTKGQELPCNRVGIVEISGANVISGYYNNPEANRESFNGTWFSTGDMGFMDEKDRLCITGRQKEMIIVHGQNYYPYDIELIALKGSNNSMKNIVVCGIYDVRVAKEKVILFYVPNKRDIDSTIPLLIKMNERVNDLAGFPINHFVRITNKDIPRTSSGKVMRRVLVENFLKGTWDKEIEKVEELMSWSRNQAKEMSEIDHEKVLKTVWGEVLGIPGDKISLGENLFKIGGDSIKAMRIQGRLEKYYKAKLESNFNYLFPILIQQIQYFQNRDLSVEPPQTEFEMILQSVIASTLNINKDGLGVTDNLISKLQNISQMMKLTNEIKRVFDIEELSEEFLDYMTIRQMSDYLWKEFIEKSHTGEKEYESFPVMNFQETLYFHRKGFVRNEPTGLSCYIFVNCYMRGEFRLNIFNRALNYVIDRHPVLRAIIDEKQERPRMRVLKDVNEVQVDYKDMASVSRDKQRDVILTKGLKHNDHRFKIDQWPMFYFEVHKLGENEHVFMINFDHLLVDGFSFMHVMDEVFNTYDKMCLGEDWKLPEVPMTFADYVFIERLRQQTPEYQQAMEFELGLFKDLPPKAVPPCKRNPAVLEDVFFDTYYQEMEAEIIDNLNTISNEYQVSLNSLLFSAYFKLMNMWCHQDDLIINMPVFNREQYFSGARKVVGSFIDIFPVRVQTHFEEPIFDIAKKVEVFTRELLRVPVSSIELSRRIFEKEGLRATSMSSIIFSNSIGMYAGEISSMKTIQLEKPEFRTGAPGTLIDLVIYDYRITQDSEDQYYFNWNFIRDLFDTSFIETLAEQYRSMLIQLGELHKQDRLSDQFTGEGIIPERYQRLMDEVNQTETEYPIATLHELIKKQVEKFPDNVALTCGNSSVTYLELHERSNQVAALLKDMVAQRGDFVALLMDRSIEMIIGQLGILKAGGTYVPIDKDFPPERIEYLLGDSEARILLTEAKQLPLLETIHDNLNHIVVLDAERADWYPQKPFRAKLYFKNDIHEQNTSELSPASQPDGLAYMIYTSGSTGKPKGVMIRHRNISNFLHWVRQEFAIDSHERFAFITSYAFDMTLTSNWVPLLTGASLHILSEEETRDVRTLLQFLSKKQITFLNVTPSHFSLLANAREYLGDKETISLSENMRIMLGGEVINTRDLNLWLQYYPSHKFINEYGPTETSVASAFFPIPVNKDNHVEMDVVPIGKPLFNTQIHILNKEMKPCMVGVKGELYIGGAGVAMGYHNKPEKTEKAFVPNSFGHNSEMLYRTGDMVRMLNDSNIEYLGREDHQINLRGYRIEAGEVENAMREFDPIMEAAMIPIADTSGSKVLVGFYTSADGSQNDSKIRKFLSNKLPDYMIPVHFEHLERMPTTPSGKLDKTKLSDVTIESGRVGDQHIRPRTELEKRLTTIWEEVIGITNLGIHDNFWDVGGDSVQAMRLIMRMKKEGFVDFGLSEVFNYQTVASIVEYIQRKEDMKEEDNHVVTLKSSAINLARLFCLPYACGNPTMYSEFNRLMPGNYEILAANLPGHDGIGEPVRSIAEIARPYVDMLAKLKDIPTFILGYSFGGYIAYEITRILEEQDVSIAGWVIVASPPPGIKKGLSGILGSSDEEITEYSKKVYNYDFSNMMDNERRDYLKTLKIDTQAMVDFNFGKPVSAPALILVGESEEEEDIKIHIEKWGDVIERCTFEEIPGRHMLIKTHTRQLADRVSRFINDMTLSDEAMLMNV
jgi:polyketide synthase PksJ